MAIRSVVESDISGKPDAATVTFGLGDSWFEIDLTDEERKELESSLKRYVDKGRKATPPKGEKKKLVPDTTPEEPRRSASGVARMDSRSPRAAVSRRK